MHKPGTMKSNLVVIEVKPIRADIKKAKKDIETLIEFLDYAEYFQAIHLVYGGNQEDIKDYILKVFETDQLNYSDSLHLFWHKFTGLPVQNIKWDELVM